MYQHYVGLYFFLLFLLHSQSHTLHHITTTSAPHLSTVCLFCVESLRPSKDSALAIVTWFSFFFTLSFPIFLISFKISWGNNYFLQYIFLPESKELPVRQYNHRRGVDQCIFSLSFLLLKFTIRENENGLDLGVGFSPYTSVTPVKLLCSTKRNLRLKTPRHDTTQSSVHRHPQRKEDVARVLSRRRVSQQQQRDSDSSVTRYEVNKLKTWTQHELALSETTLVAEGGRRATWAPGMSRLGRPRAAPLLLLTSRGHQECCHVLRHAEVLWQPLKTVTPRPLPASLHTTTVWCK